MKKSRKICIINYKGGTGKTSTVVNLGHGLALKGKRVLIVDTDPQGSSGYHLGVKSDFSLYDLLVGTKPLQDCITQARPSLDIITSNERLFPAEMALVTMRNRERILSQKLRNVERFYDYVLMDCAPSINLLNQNSLTFSNEIFIPVSMEFLSLVGIKQLLNNIEIINRIVGHNIAVTKLIPTFFNKRHTKSKNVLKSLQRVFSQVMATPIRYNVAISEAAGFKKTIFEHNPKSNGAIDYQKLTEEVLADG